MNQKTRIDIKTGDYPIVDDWAKLLPDDAFRTITTYIPDYKKVVKIRRSTRKPQISTLEDSFQLVINYNYYRDCFIVWNAAIQEYIHHGKKIRLSIGSKGEKALQQALTPDSIISVYRPIGQNFSELILIIGIDALPSFCKEYKNMIVPDPNLIPKGRPCLYAIAGQDIVHIQSRKDI